MLLPPFRICLWPSTSVSHAQIEHFKGHKRSHGTHEAGKMSSVCGFGSPCLTRSLNTLSASSSCSFVCKRPSSGPRVFLRKRLRSTALPTKCTALSSESVPVESATAEGASAEGASTGNALAISPSVPIFSPAPNTLSSALREMFSEVEQKRAPREILQGLLAANVEWRNPLFTATSFDAVISNLDSLLNFVLDPRILLICEREVTSDSAEIEWLFSFVYPLPWRPRVSIGGRTVAERAERGIIRITDSWNGSPWYILRQSMLRFQDLIWLWPSPHAETDIGIRRLESKTKDYSVVVFPSHPEFRFRGEIKKFERHAIWSTPALPHDAYAGTIRRLENYDAVSPIAVRKIQGDEFEWAIRLPGAFLGRDLRSFEHPSAAAEYVMVPERRMAVVRFRGFATAKVFLAKRDSLLNALVRDGLINKESTEDCTRVWSRLYDCKLGFNVKGMPTLATYGYSQVLPRVNEIAIELHED